MLTSLLSAAHERFTREPSRAARSLMKRLGYTKFVAQGGDWGAIINELMGAQAPAELLGIHTNMPNVIPLDIDKAAFSGGPAPAGRRWE